jgi:sporadic carbohydrate cluster 2OG-Fe(II) oxygenase
MSAWKEEFLKRGFIVAPADDLAPLLALRKSIFEKSREIFDSPSDDVETFFNQFHNLNITGVELNERRMKLIQYCTQHIDSGTLIFQAFRSTLLEMLGPDLLVQKNTNLVVQQPNDPNPSELHRDSPTNSPYEVVVWLPLVDAYASKSMYLLDREKTKKALERLSSLKEDWESFEQSCIEMGEELSAPFGTALFFWPGLFHGSRINQEKETRWTINMRYKSLFTPNGIKEPFEFFKVFSLSPLSAIALDYQKSELEL